MPWGLCTQPSLGLEADVSRSPAGLLYPSATVMDLNIGAALWMAAKAEGQVTVIPGTTASREPPHRHEAVKHSAAETKTALPRAARPSGAGAATALPEEAVTHAGNTSRHRTPWHEAVQAQMPSQQAAAEMAGHQSNLGTPSALVNAAHTSRESLDRAACTSSTFSAMLCAACSQAASPSVAEPYQNFNPVEQAGGEQNGSIEYGWYRSAARVVLLGHGADEQHAGYGRHRTSFRNQVSLAEQPGSVACDIGGCMLALALSAYTLEVQPSVGSDSAC